MRNVTYILGHYESPAKTAPLKLFLMEMTYPLRSRKIPPFEILNQMLNCGVAPRIGEWEPFTITKEEYDELVADLQANPQDRYAILESSPAVKTINDWNNHLENLGY